MKNNEEKEVEEYLKKLISKELSFFDDDKLEFYSMCKINFKKARFERYPNEKFFVLMMHSKYGIYFNDIEEGFGICKFFNEKCIMHAEFSNDTLYGTIERFQELILNDNMDEVLSS
jgi:hypothetical protein